MRILVVLSSLFTGGAEFSTLSFYGWLKAQPGFEVMVVCYKKAKIEFDPTTFGLADVQYLSGDGFWKKKKMLDKIVRSYKPQVLHSVLFEANIVSRFTRYNNPFVVHVESLVNEVYSRHRLSDPNVSWIKLKGYQLFDYLTQLRGVDHFHANGVSVANHYRDKLKIAGRRITIIPRGRKSNAWLGDAASRQRLRSEFNVDDSAFLLVSVGRHEYQKGQDVLIEALACIRELPLKCVIVGREGSRTDLLKSMVAKHKLESVVHFAGHRTDVDAILAASDLFVFPSRFEGLPGSMIEAEAASLPIVCSDISNNREVGDQGNTLFFTTNDSGSLASAIRKVIADPGLMSAMKTHSLLVFREKFEIVKVHQQMKAFLEEVVK